MRFLLAAALVATPAGAVAFDLQGHRGARGLAPENTLAGFAATLSLGVSTLELDLAMTRDGVVVVSHDPALNPDLTRDASGAWLTRAGPVIHELTFAEAVADEIGKAGVVERTTVQSFDWRSLVHLRRLAPEIATACLTVEQSWLDNLERGRPGASPWTAGLDIDGHGSTPRLVQAAGCAVWSPFFRELTAESLAEARDLGLTVIPWTVNDQADMARLIEMGVDGLITDRPDLAREAMARAGLRLPPARP